MRQLTIPLFFIFDSRAVVLLVRENIYFGGMDFKVMHTLVTLMYYAVLWYIVSATMKVLRGFDLEIEPCNWQ